MIRLNIILFAILLITGCKKEKISKPNSIVNPFYDKAFEFRELGKTDSAFLFFNRAKDLFITQNDSLGAAKCLLNMGIISTDNEDFYGGQEISLEALNFFNLKDKNHAVYLISNFNNLGLASYKLGEFTDALKFYDRAIVYADNSPAKKMILNNMGLVYQELGNYSEAIKTFNMALAGESDDTEVFAKLSTNISVSKWLQNNSYNAAPALLKALKIREKNNDLGELNSSYSHLSAYYVKVKPDSAKFYATKMFQVSQQANMVEDQLKAFRKLSILSSPTQAKIYFKQYLILLDSLQNVRNNAKNQFALIRYDSEKNKADNLVLQKENTSRRYQIIKRDLIIGGVLTFLIFATLAGVFWYKKRKQQLEMATHNAIRENQYKTSKKVHDIVANGLYRVMAEVENKKEIDKEYLLDKIEDLYEKSRDLSYEDEFFDEKNFSIKIASLVKSFATESIKVLLVGNSSTLWNKVNATAKYEVEHILQELMVNMKKHSNANNVVIKFENIDSQINIFYVDNGIGLPKEAKFKNGLTNTGNRIDSINGTITFDGSVDKGLRIQISFPLS